MICGQSQVDPQSIHLPKYRTISYHVTPVFTVTIRRYKCGATRQRRCHTREERKSEGVVAWSQDRAGSAAHRDLFFGAFLSSEAPIFFAPSLPLSMYCNLASMQSRRSKQKTSNFIATPPPRDAQDITTSHLRARTHACMCKVKPSRQMHVELVPMQSDGIVVVVGSVSPFLSSNQIDTHQVQQVAHGTVACDLSPFSTRHVCRVRVSMCALYVCATHTVLLFYNPSQLKIRAFSSTSTTIPNKEDPRRWTTWPLQPLLLLFPPSQRRPASQLRSQSQPATTNRPNKQEMESQLHHVGTNLSMCGGVDRATGGTNASQLCVRTRDKILFAGELKLSRPPLVAPRLPSTDRANQRPCCLIFSPIRIWLFSVWSVVSGSFFLSVFAAR